MRGWKQFKVKDELYLNYWFGEGGLSLAKEKGLTPMATSSYGKKAVTAPGETPKKSATPSSVSPCTH